MPRYYFHIRDGRRLQEDPEGAEFDNLDLAREEAVSAARELMAAKLLDGEPIDGQTFEITTEDGHVASVLPFKSVIRID